MAPRAPHSAYASRSRQTSVRSAAQSARRMFRPTPPGASRPLIPEPFQPRPGDPPHLLELAAQDRRALAGDAVRPPSVLGCERLDQAPPFEPGERSVERARPEWRPRDAFDVGHDRVAVLRPVAQ